MESEMSGVADDIENIHPLQAGTYYLYLCTVHKSLGRERGGGHSASNLAFPKAIEMTKKAGDEHLHFTQ